MPEPPLKKLPGYWQAKREAAAQRRADLKKAVADGTVTVRRLSKEEEAEIFSRPPDLEAMAEREKKRKAERKRDAERETSYKATYDRNRKH